MPTTPRPPSPTLDARLAKIGAPKLEGTDKCRQAAPCPPSHFGDRKINNNYDVVDAIRKAHSATATVFVKEGEEFVRVSTNVLTPEGKRGVGTQLARNAAYAAVSKGQQYCGPIDVLGTAFDACYNPIKDAKRQDHRRDLHRPQEVSRSSHPRPPSRRLRPRSGALPMKKSPASGALVSLSAPARSCSAPSAWCWC
jgi:hypothetical protein